MAPTLVWPQAALDAAVRKLFPASWLEGFLFPCVEDLVNASPFTTYPAWLRHSGYSGMADAQFHAFGCFHRGQQAAALGMQRGGFTSKHAIDPIIGHGIGESAHFEAARAVAAAGKLPFDEQEAAGAELRFAAAKTVENWANLRSHRRACARAMAELADRCRPLHICLARQQAPSVARIAGKVHLGLLAVMVVLMEWPDWRLPLRFIGGFRIVGVLERTNIFEPKGFEEPVPKAVLLQNAAKIIASIESSRPSPDAEFLWDSCLKEHEKGFGGPPRDKSYFDGKFGPGGWSPIPSFCITQADGKQRRIDNGRSGGQNSATAYTETARLCSAFQPGLHAKLLFGAAASAGMSDEMGQMHVVTGGEDLPDAFRSIPCDPEDLNINIVAIKRADGTTMYQQLDAMLFGLSAAVIQFGRWSRFLEAAIRRFLAILWSMYVDDGTLMDLQVAKAAGQAAIGQVFALFGAPLADRKRLPMAAINPFLGVFHDVSQAAARGVVYFWPSEKVAEKALYLLDSMVGRNCCTPAEASKFCGTAGFCAHALSGRVGRCGFGPFRQRQYSDSEPWTLSNSLRRSILFLQLILSDRPKRVLNCHSSHEPLVIIASDAQADAGTQPGCGYLLFDARSGDRRGGFCTVPEDILCTWGYPAEVRAAGANPIALCEAGIVAEAMLREARSLAGRRVLWFVDNTVALQSMIKGGSRHPVIDRAAHLFHLYAHGHQVDAWFEFVPSADNWSDGISRLQSADPFAKEHGFEIHPLQFHQAAWQADLADLWQQVRCR